MPVSAADLDGQTRAAAVSSGLRPGDRLMTSGTWSLDYGPSGTLVHGLLGPLAAGAGIIHCADLEAAEQQRADPITAAAQRLRRRAGSEGATHTRGLSVPGLPLLP